MAVRLHNVDVDGSQRNLNEAAVPFAVRTRNWEAPEADTIARC